MAGIILWMGIGSTFFTHRTEASTQNFLQQMQRPPGAYNVDVPANHSTNDLDHFSAPDGIGSPVASGSAANLVNSK